MEPALITLATKRELAKIYKKDGWSFRWSTVPSSEVEVVKICLDENPLVIQGLMAINKQTDHLFLPLIESSPTNRGKTKKYDEVLQTLTAYACWLSVQEGNEGVVVFEPKTVLIKHYEEKLGAILLTKKRMAIMEQEAHFLITSYLLRNA